jgi:acetolactate synthase-1/2/3 large subunit
VLTDPGLLTTPRLSSMVKPDGTIVSKPLEDLWPFLAREEFRKNMIIEPVEE